jgi:hypothetical protein
VSEGRRGEDSLLTRVPASYQSIKCSSQGSGRGCRELGATSSKAKIRPRGRPALERGGDSPKGASSPRARWRSHGAASGPRARRRFARGGVRPSSEAEIHQRGRPALERGGDLVVRRLALERGGSSPEGRRGWTLDGPLRLFGSCALVCTRP